ncbi:MAG: segregation/condensation protein A [Malacoplasma sp.]|nr:segregation/condensation protein A [Malacoplasma sp.]
MNDEKNSEQQVIENTNNNDFKIEITTVKGETFNGPFDLFYSLIKDRKMDILNINLVEIIELYGQYISQNLMNLTIDDLTEYLLMATYLLEQKSKRILPSMETEKEISDDIERDKEIQRMLIFKQFELLIPNLAERYEKRLRMFEKAPQKIEEVVDMESVVDPQPFMQTLDLNVILKAMQKVYLKLVANKKRPKKPYESKIKVIGVSEISIENVEQEILEFLKPFAHLHKISFLDYFSNIPYEKFTKRYFVVAFVAILVLVKNGDIILEQNSADEEIFIVKIDKEVLSCGD